MNLFGVILRAAKKEEEEKQSPTREKKKQKLVLENPANGAANNDPILCIKFMFIWALCYLAFSFSPSLFLFSLLHFPILICIKINGGTEIVCVA